MTPTVAIITMTGSEVAYTIPAGTRSIKFQPRTASVQVRTTTGSTPYFTLMFGDQISMQGDDLGGKSLIFTGTAALIVEVFYTTA